MHLRARIALSKDGERVLAQKNPKFGNVSEMPETHEVLPLHMNVNMSYQSTKRNSPDYLHNVTLARTFVCMHVGGQRNAIWKFAVPEVGMITFDVPSSRASSSSRTTLISDVCSL